MDTYRTVDGDEDNCPPCPCVLKITDMPYGTHAQDHYDYNPDIISVYRQTRRKPMGQQYVAAYRADNGNIIAMATPNTVRRYAEMDVSELQERDRGGTEYFVAIRDMPDWQRA